MIVTQPIRKEHPPYPFEVMLENLQVGDVVELIPDSLWSHAIVSDTQRQNEEFPSVKVWRPHFAVETFTKRNEQPAMRYEIFDLYGRGAYTLIGNCGTELVSVEEK